MATADSHQFEHYEDSERFIDALKNGNRSAWKALVQHQQEKLLAFFQKRLELYDPQTCQDLAQIVWLIAYKKIKRFKSSKQDGVLRWIYGIAGYVVLRHLHKHNHFPMFSLDDIDEEREIARVTADFTDDDPLQKVILAQLMGQIVECLEGERPRNQEIFVLRFVHGLSYNEIALQCGVTEANAAKIIERMRLRLREHLPAD